jgi:hypothetical protein
MTGKNVPRTRTPPKLDCTMQSKQDPAVPLKNQQHETFAQSFASKPDAIAAALSAGYRPRSAANTAGRLLSEKSVIQRIENLRNKNAEALTISTLIHELYVKPKSALTKAITKNPFTNEVSLDLSRLTSSEIASLDPGLLAGDGNIGSGSKARVRSRQTGALTALGQLVRDPNYTAKTDEKNSLAAALREMASRNASTAPIWHDYETDSD